MTSPPAPSLEMISKTDRMLCRDNVILLVIVSSLPYLLFVTLMLHYEKAAL